MRTMKSYPMGVATLIAISTFLVVACGKNVNSGGFKAKKRNGSILLGIDGKLGSDPFQGLSGEEKNQMVRRLAAQHFLGKTDAELNNAQLMLSLFPESAADSIMAASAQLNRAGNDKPANLLVASLSTVLGPKTEARNSVVKGEFQNTQVLGGKDGEGIQYQAKCYDECRNLLLMVTNNGVRAAFLFAVAPGSGEGTVVASSLGSQLIPFQEARNLVAEVTGSPGSAVIAPPTGNTGSAAPPVPKDDPAPTDDRGTGGQGSGDGVNGGQPEISGSLPAEPAVTPDGGVHQVEPTAQEASSPVTSDPTSAAAPQQSGSTTGESAPSKPQGDDDSGTTVLSADSQPPASPNSDQHNPGETVAPSSQQAASSPAAPTTPNNEPALQTAAVPGPSNVATGTPALQESPGAEASVDKITAPTWIPASIWTNYSNDQRNHILTLVASAGVGVEMGNTEYREKTRVFLSQIIGVRDEDRSKKEVVDYVNSLVSEYYVDTAALTIPYFQVYKDSSTRQIQLEFAISGSRGLVLFGGDHAIKIDLADLVKAKTSAFSMPISLNSTSEKDAGDLVLLSIKCLSDCSKFLVKVDFMEQVKTTSDKSEIEHTLKIGALYSFEIEDIKRSSNTNSQNPLRKDHSTSVRGWTEKTFKDIHAKSEQAKQCLESKSKSRENCTSDYVKSVFDEYVRIYENIQKARKNQSAMK